MSSSSCSCFPSLSYWSLSKSSSPKLFLAGEIRPCPGKYSNISFLLLVITSLIWRAKTSFSTSNSSLIFILALLLLSLCMSFSQLLRIFCRSSRSSLFSSASLISSFVSRIFPSSLRKRSSPSPSWSSLNSSSASSASDLLLLFVFFYLSDNWSKFSSSSSIIIWSILSSSISEFRKPSTFGASAFYTGKVGRSSFGSGASSLAISSSESGISSTF